MKKRVYAILLVAMMILSLTACGEKEQDLTDETIDKTQNNTVETTVETAAEQTDNSSEEPYRIEKDAEYNGEKYGYVIYITREELANRLTEVELTKDNWKDYVGDYEFTENVDGKDQVFRGFGGKGVVCGEASLSFDGSINITNPEEGETKEVLQDSIISLLDRAFNDAYLQGNHEFVAVSGKIIVMDLPIETRRSVELCFVDEDGKSFCAFNPVNVSMIYMENYLEAE